MAKVPDQNISLDWLPPEGFDFKPLDIAKLLVSLWIIILNAIVVAVFLLNSSLRRFREIFMINLFVTGLGAGVLALIDSLTGARWSNYRENFLPALADLSQQSHEDTTIKPPAGCFIHTWAFRLFFYPGPFSMIIVCVNRVGRIHHQVDYRKLVQRKDLALYMVALPYGISAFLSLLPETTVPLDHSIGNFFSLSGRCSSAFVASKLQYLEFGFLFVTIVAILICNCIILYAFSRRFVDRKKENSARIVQYLRLIFCCEEMIHNRFSTKVHIRRRVSEIDNENDMTTGRVPEIIESCIDKPSHSIIKSKRRGTKYVPQDKEVSEVSLSGTLNTCDEETMSQSPCPSISSSKSWSLESFDTANNISDLHPMVLTGRYSTDLDKAKSKQDLREARAKRKEEERLKEERLKEEARIAEELEAAKHGYNVGFKSDNVTRLIQPITVEKDHRVCTCCCCCWRKERRRRRRSVKKKRTGRRGSSGSHTPESAPHKPGKSILRKSGSSSTLTSISTSTSNSVRRLSIDSSVDELDLKDLSKSRSYGKRPSHIRMKAPSFYTIAWCLAVMLHPFNRSRRIKATRCHRPDLHVKAITLHITVSICMVLLLTPGMVVKFLTADCFDDDNKLRSNAHELCSKLWIHDASNWCVFGTYALNPLLCILFHKAASVVVAFGCHQCLADIRYRCC